MSQRKKTREPVVNTSRLPPELQERMRDDAGKGTEAILTSDYAWIGEDGELYDTPLSSLNLEVRPLDQAIAIARADGLVRSGAARKSRTVSKLRMEWEAHKRGPKHYVDDYLLCKIAEAYHKAFFSDPSKYPNLDPIIKDVIKKHAPSAALESSSDAALLARLRRKFNAQKDGLLCAVGAEDLPERGPELARVRRELDDLEDRGVQIDRSRLDAALSRKPNRS